MTTGWQCPNCSRCYAPSVTQCPSCDPSNYVTRTQVYPNLTPSQAPANLTCERCGKAVALTIDGIGICCKGRTA